MVTDLQVIIRQALITDASQIATLISEMGYPTRPEEMGDRLRLIGSSPDYITYVAVSGSESEIVGIVGGGLAPYYEKNGLYGRLLVLAVAAGYRNRGIGRLLVEEIERWFRAKHVRVIVVNSGSSRTEAHQFYERVGFQQTGLRFVKEL
jgi:GNAT superfamily N-acetyltransferase